jgi:hypothetical protein
MAEKNHEAIVVRVAAEQKREFERIGVKLEMPTSAVVRFALRQGLEIVRKHGIKARAMAESQ